MARDTVPPLTTTSPVRRRSSAHQYHFDNSAFGNRLSPPSSQHAARRRQSSGAVSPTRMPPPDSLGAPREMATTGTDLPDASPSASQQEITPRVRFSTDVERRPVLKHKNSDEVVPGTEARGRTSTPTLGVNTNVGGASSRLGRSPGSPASLRSPDSTASPRPPTRSRGQSLRSALFHKNVRDASIDGRPSIELGHIGPSSSISPNTRSHRPGHQKKSSEVTMVEIQQTHSSTSKSSDDFSKMDKWRLSERLGDRLPGLPNYSHWLERQAARNPHWRKAKAKLLRWRKIILRVREIPPSKDGRHIDIDPARKDSFLDERTNKQYIGNAIRSSRYTLWNFVPRQLWAQFSKLANFYFLLVSIFQLIPGLSTTGQFTTIVPLLFFVGVSISKEGYDDLRRYRLDKVENNQEATVLRSDASEWDESSELEEEAKKGEGAWKKVKWQNIKVGDVIKLERDDAVPADIVLLSTQGPNGIATVETMALDGETNLKSKQVHPKIAAACKTPQGIATSGAHLVVEDPNLDLYNFEGKVTCNGTTAPLTNNEIVYRGSIIRNTPSATGLVIYTGEECKIRMNANKNPRIKAPHLQSVVNKVVIVVVIFVLILSIFNTVAYQVWRRRIERPSWYLRDATVPFFPILVSFIIMFNTMIPLSLYVSLEIVKLCQMLLLNDIDMYDETTNTPFEARTSTINEELGQIGYIFSDKTGTLTENLMKFRKLSVAGTSWLHDADLELPEEKLRHKKRKIKSSKGKKPADQPRLSFNHPFTPEPERTPKIGDPEVGDTQGVQPQRKQSQWQSSARPDKVQPELSTAVMIDYIQRRPHTEFAKKAKMLLLSIALCHTCLPEQDENGKIDYQASSPDELALVRAAQELDFLVYNRDGASLTLRTYPNGKDCESVDEQYEILDVIEFSSKRKRMSVLVRCPDGRIIIICKGADTIVMERLRLAQLARDKTNHIEARVSKRKSLEASEAIRRRSEATDIGRTSFSRTSISLPRRSFGIGRTSMSGKLQPIRDEVDSWLNEREHDVTAGPEELDEFYTPRPSMHLPRRSSVGHMDARSSIWGDDDEDDDEDLVDDELATDEDAVIERCFQHVNDFATEGLRTLLYGHRFLEEQEYNAWKKIYLDATTSLVDRQAMIERAGELIEQSLELTGATAIEDKLQHGVPEAIDKLRRANIKMWMLTGDKRETAINIGHSCRLIKDYSTVTILDKEMGHLEERIAAAILDVTSGSMAHSVIVIDGQTLSTVESDSELKKLFLDLAIFADSVVCCRASPSQKSGLVKAIRRRVKNSITLAIGDGANDIAMIQEAHVGIGITGREGLQAARVSDYSIAQFRFLVKLLLVHGRWNYVRVCKYTVGTFWKEMVFYLVQAMYQRYNGYTGTSLYESWSLSVFNTLFTSLCVIFLGVFEKDLSASTLIAVPELYAKGQRNQGFNFKVYLGWMFTAVSEAMIIFFIMFSLYGQAQFTDYQDLFSTGDLAFGACVILINLKLQGTEIHYKSVMALTACVLSIGGWFLWNIVLSGTYKDNKIYFVRHGFTERFGRNILWWVVLVFAVSATLLFEIVLRSLKAAFFPTDTETFQVLEQDLGVRKRFEEAAAMELQAGWRRGSKKSSMELEREEELRREREMEELIRRRTRDSGEGDAQKDAHGLGLVDTRT